MITNQFNPTRKPVLPLLPKKPLNQNPAPQAVAISEPNLSFQPAQAIPGVPPETGVFGMSQDGLPVLIHFNDRSAAPILVAGDEGCGKTSLLKYFARTALFRDLQQSLSLTILTTKPEVWLDLSSVGSQTGHFVGIYHPMDDGLESHLQQLSALITKRQARKYPGSPILFIIDDLSILKNAPNSLRGYLEQIMHHGHQAQVWTAAAIHTRDISKMGRWTRYFRTRLIGHMQNTLACRLGLFTGLDAEKLAQKGEYAVMTSGRWLIFRSPAAHSQFQSEIDQHAVAFQTA